MKRGNTIKAVVFDVGGVLSLGKNSSWKGKVFVPSGIHEEIARELKVSLDQYMDAIDTNYALAIEGKIKKEKVLNIFSKNLKVSKEKLVKIYIKSYRNHFTSNKQLFKQAFSLKKLGYKIAVLSDQWYLSREALMPGKVYKKFNLVLVSCEQGMRKPNPLFYKLLIKRLKLNTSEILFIDNQIWNIKPARKLGLKTILFKDNKSLFKNSKWKALFS